jgi:hypothetical protein
MNMRVREFRKGILREIETSSTKLEGEMRTGACPIWFISQMLPGKSR